MKKFNFKSIKSFEDACKHLNLDPNAFYFKFENMPDHITASQQWLETSSRWKDYSVLSLVLPCYGERTGGKMVQGYPGFKKGGLSETRWNCRPRLCVLVSRLVVFVLGHRLSPCMQIERNCSVLCRDFQKLLGVVPVPTVMANRGEAWPPMVTI